jgi:hypothetical protein
LEEEKAIPSAALKHGDAVSNVIVMDGHSPFGSLRRIESAIGCEDETASHVVFFSVQGDLEGPLGHICVELDKLTMR